MLQGMVMGSERLKVTSRPLVSAFGWMCRSGKWEDWKRSRSVICLLALRYNPDVLCPVLYCMELPSAVFSTFWLLWVGLANEWR